MTKAEEAVIDYIISCTGPITIGAVYEVAGRQPRPGIVQGVVGMPRGTKVAKAERALRASARKKGLTGERAAKYIYGTLNKIGLKKGNKTTPRGRSRAHRGK